MEQFGDGKRAGETSGRRDRTRIVTRRTNDHRARESLVVIVVGVVVGWTTGRREPRD